MGGKVEVFAICNPEALDRPEAVALFHRCFANPKFEQDADEVREFLRDELAEGNENIRLWVASTPQHGFCGMSLVTFGGAPLTPHPYVAHFVAEVPEAREPLTAATFRFLRESGHESVAIINVTGRSDRAHMRLFRKFVSGRVSGSVIVYRLEG